MTETRVCGLCRAIPELTPLPTRPAPHTVSDLKKKITDLESSPDAGSEGTQAQLKGLKDEVRRAALRPARIVARIMPHLARIVA